MSESAKYILGIDLGTTHSVLSYTEKQPEHTTVKILPIPQLTAPGQVENLNQLGSFIYQASEHEMGEGSRTLPWSASSEALVGAIARKLGSKTPLRLIASAKSWLCHSQVNRRDAFLPAGSPEEITKLSPLRATELYLQHLKQAWNHSHPDDAFTEQDIAITVPASFDPAARDLTAEAARNIGIEHLTLLEEPQAALYNWIEKTGDNWRNQLNVGDTVLIIDIGGGTTDLSLVAVTEQEGNLTLERVAIGEHILLGGDNMDLALAYRLKMKMAQQGVDLQPWQLQAITHACRDAKETLLQEQELDSIPIIIPSRGSKLLGNTLKTELTKQEVKETLIDGFFPIVNIDEQPMQKTRGALTQIGLPYAQDAGITRHIAAFLTKQSDSTNNLFGDMFSQKDTDFIKPTALLFNGGVLKADALSNRLMEVINLWLDDTNAAPTKQLQGSNLDLAVASGAAYYGQVRQGKGVRIRGGIASSYYVGIESAMPAIPGMAPPMEALCVAPFGMEEGSSIEVTDKEFGLIIGQPVHFQFYGSTVRRDDNAGTHLDYWRNNELKELPEIHITLDATDGRQIGDVVAVTLATRVTELGTLYLEAIAKDNKQKWHVEFDVREATATTT